LGVGVNNWTAARREHRRFRTETALELAGIERALWDESWLDLNALLLKHEARMAVAGVPSELIESVRRLSLASWYDRREAEEQGLPEVGIKKDLLDALRLQLRAVRAYLLGASRRERNLLRRDALEQSRDVLGDMEEEL
jgi:hypothetical protein